MEKTEIASNNLEESHHEQHLGPKIFRVKSMKAITNADLSDKTESATSFADQVLLSFDFMNMEFGGPI